MQAPQKAAVIDGSSLNLNFVQLNIYRRGLYYSTPHVLSGGCVRPSLLPIHSHGALRIFYSASQRRRRRRRRCVRPAHLLSPVRQAGQHSASVDPCLATGLPSKKLNFKSFSLARLKILRPKYACALTDRTGSLAAGAIKSGRKDI